MGKGFTGASVNTTRRIKDALCLDKRKGQHLGLALLSTSWGLHPSKRLTAESRSLDFAHPPHCLCLSERASSAKNYDLHLWGEEATPSVGPGPNYRREVSLRWTNWLGQQWHIDNLPPKQSQQERESEHCKLESHPAGVASLKATRRCTWPRVDSFWNPSPLIKVSSRIFPPPCFYLDGTSCPK